MRTISEFHYSTVILDGTMFKSDEPLHAELALPDWHGRNFDVLLDCLER
jgi:RNAse (barnase) inhibitor barstar